MSEISRYNLEHFFELSGDLICIAGFDGYFKKINPAVSRLLGFSNEELFSRPINEFVYPEDQAVTEKVREELRNNKPLLNFENRYVTKEGDIVWLAWTSMPVYEEGLVYAIAKNITHRKRLEEERNILLSELTRINKDFQQFAYTASHDLRSPINSMLTAFSLLDASRIEDSQTVTIIEILKKGIQNLKQTLNQYLTVLNDKKSLNDSLQELDLEETLNNTLNSIKSLVEDSKAVIYVDLSAVKKVKFNRAYLESIFLNLITNSIKYSKPKSHPEISIYTKVTDGDTQLIVSDKGLGFDMDKVKGKIFGLNEKFHDHTDSKGIGLYLVYNHITSLGGSIEVESKVNEGAKFTVTFKS